VEAEAKSTVPRWSAVLIHGLESIIAVSNENDLFHAVIDNEQVADLLIVDLT
jgi:hypothetical protein